MIGPEESSKPVVCVMLSQSQFVFVLPSKAYLLTFAVFPCLCVREHWPAAVDSSVILRLPHSDFDSIGNDRYLTIPLKIRCSGPRVICAIGWSWRWDTDVSQTWCANIPPDEGDSTYQKTKVIHQHGVHFHKALLKFIIAFWYAKWFALRRPTFVLRCIINVAWRTTGRLF